MAWVPALFIRTWHWTPKEIGIAYGTIILIFGLSGMLVSGFVADRLASKGKLQSAFLVGLVGAVATFPFLVGMAFSHSPLSVLICLSGITFFLGFPIALAPSVYQSITPNRLRGQVIGFYLLANNLIGMSAGPMAVALLINYVYKDELKVGSLLSWVCLSACIMGVLLLLRSWTPYRVLLMEKNGRA